MGKPTGFLEYRRVAVADQGSAGQQVVAVGGPDSGEHVIVDAEQGDDPVGHLAQRRR